MIRDLTVKPRVSHLYRDDNHLWLVLNDVEDWARDVTDTVNSVTAPVTKNGGTTTPGGAPNVTIDKTDPNGKPNPVITPRSNGQIEVQVYYTLAPEATADNFSGVDVYLEDPDISSQASMPMSGTRPMDGTTNQVSGKWTPVFENKSSTVWTGSAAAHGPVDILVDNTSTSLKKGMDRKVRIYLASYGPNSNAVLVRANQPNATPSVIAAIPPPGTIYVRGQEYAWLVTNCQVQLETDFDRPDPNYRLLFSYTPPDLNTPLPTGMNPFGGVDIFYAYPDVKNIDPYYVITDSKVWVSVTDSHGYLSPIYPAGGGGTFRAYFCSGDNSQPSHVNQLIPGVTPYVQVTISLSLPNAPDITGFKLVKTYWSRRYDGSLVAMADIAWDKQTAANFGGVVFYLIATNPTDPNYKLPMQLDMVGDTATFDTLEVLNWPVNAEDWTILAVSQDAFSQENNTPSSPRVGSPEILWHIGGPITQGGIGQEHAPLVTPLNLPTPIEDQQVSSDGVQMMRFTISGWTIPKDNNFGGAKVAMIDVFGGITYFDAGKATSLTTPWMPASSAGRIYFYVISYDPQNLMNSIDQQPGGTTPFTYDDFKPKPGAIKASQIPTDWFSTNDFVWKNAPGPFNPNDPLNTGLLINQVDAGRVQVGTVLRVGGAPASSGLGPSFSGKNGQIAVYSSGTDPGDINGTPTLRAWIGQQSSGGGTIYGGWFSELYVGGSGPPTSPLYVKNGGLVIVGGWDVQTSLGTKYFPYISVRDKRNTEQARIGASLSANPDGTYQVPIGNIADIGGGWFTQIAIGGPNLANWNILVPGDGTIHMRGINTFEIDYTRNIPAISPPTNAPYQLLLGTDVAYAAVGINKFPGITLMRWDDVGNKATTHGMQLINRGILLSTQDATTTEQKRAALYTFNGDSQGYDGGRFWGELALFSPTTGIINVLMNSGYFNAGILTGGSSLTMGDEHNNISFQVRSTRDIVLGAQVFWGPTASIQLIDASGTYIGPIKAGDFSANSYSIGTTEVIDSSRNLVNSNVNIGANYWIDSGQITASSLYIRVGGIATPIINGFGQWVGPAMTGAQTPWTQTIYAQGNELHDAGRIVAQLSTYVLRNSPNASFGEHVLDLTGPGILLMSAGGGYPRMDLQPSSISMLNSGGSQVFHVDLNGVLTCSTCNAGIWTGSVQTGTNFVYATQFGIYGYAAGVGTTATPVTFPTNDGRTVTVVGGIITKVQ